MANVQAASALTVTASEVSTNTIVLNRSIPNLLNTQLTVQDYESYHQVPSAAPENLTLPIATLQIFMIANRAAAGGGNIAVTLTPNGGVAAKVADLTPGSALMIFETDLTKGITAVTLQASAGTVPAEIYMAG